MVAREALRISLRPISHSFTVEVRRRRGPPSTTDAKPILRESLSWPAGDIAHDADKDASKWFSGHAHERALDSASAIPKGRILPSLVETVPGGLSTTESKLPKRLNRQGRTGDETAKQKINADNASERRRRRSLDGEDLIPPQRSLKAAPEDLAQARSADEMVPTVPEQVEPSARTRQTAATSTATERPHRHGRRAKSQTSSENIFTSASNAHLANSSILGDDDVSRKRHQSILARYVFGTEPKLGERWKRRLRRPH
jgi:hypothetical protein